MNAESGDRAAVGSRSEFDQAAKALLCELPQIKPRGLVLVDADFSPWPLADPVVLESLTQWIRLPGRRLRLLGSRFDMIERDQSRFAQWRRSFSHAIECFSPTDVEPADMPSLMLADATGLELLDRERYVARRTTGRRWLVLQHERIDALLQRSETAWPVTVLGL